MKTKAVRLYGKSDLRLEEFELPQIKENEILARVVSDSICMSSYKAAIQGEDHKRVPNDIKENPVIIGHEFSGEVVEVGEKVTLYNVSYNLQNANADISAAAVIGGKEFSANISAAENCDNLCVTVKMGGEDVTAEVYKDGKISISSVTGDIEITAKAARPAKDFRWEFDGTNLVSVSENGVVEGKGVGTAVVKAISNTGRLGLVEIVVYDPETYPTPYLSLTQDNVALFVGDEFAVTYTYTYLGEVIDGTVQMTSDNTSIVTVENGMIRAVGVGTANVLVKVNSSHGEAAKNIKVNVTEKQTEFYPSFVGKDLYVGNPLALVMYVNENGAVKTENMLTVSF